MNMSVGASSKGKKMKETSSEATNQRDAAEKAAALFLVQGGDEKEVRTEARYADSWHNFIAALVKLKSSCHSPSATSPTATPDAALSEVGSGCSSPYRCWPDEEDEQAEVEDSQSECSPASKSSRRRHRRRGNRRRTRRGGGSSAASTQGDINEKVPTLSLAHSGVKDQVSCENRCVDSWHTIMAALIKLKFSSAPSSTTSATTTPNFGLSEAGSGRSSPRLCWADEEEEPSDEEDSQSECSPPSKGARRRNRRGTRRRRTRRGRGRASSGAMAGVVDAEGFGPIDEENAVGSGSTQPCSNRDVVLLSDLFLGLDSGSADPICAEADFPVRNEPIRTVDANLSSGMTMTPPVRNNYTQAHGSSPLPPRFDASPPVSPGLCIANMTFIGQPCTWVPVEVGGRASDMQTLVPRAIDFTSAVNMASPCCHDPLLSSPCHDRTAPKGGIMSTLPTALPGPCSPAGAIAGAGSQSADALRWWLHASGLPSAADVVAQLQAAAPEVYED